MFEKIDSINNKNIGKLEKKIEDARAAMETLESQINTDLSLDEYTGATTKISAYKQYISKCQEEIQYINNNRYTVEDVEAAQKEIQKEYNPKLKKSLTSLVNAANDLIKRYEEYQEVNGKFINTREEFYEKCINANMKGNVYAGDNAIVNDSNIELNDIVEQVKHRLSEIKID